MCTLRFNALPKCWISVTEPLCALFRLNPAFLIRWADMARYTIPSTRAINCRRLANKNLNWNGKLSTHWRMGCSGNTSSTNGAALSAIRRATPRHQVYSRLVRHAPSASIAWLLKCSIKNCPHIYFQYILASIEKELSMKQQRPATPVLPPQKHELHACG